METSVQKASSTKKHSEKTQETLTGLRYRIGGWTFANDVWERLMTARERQQLGGELEKARRLHHGIVGMWRRVRNVSDARAIVDIAYGIGLLEVPRREWLLRQIGDEVKSRSETDAPAWNHATGELTYRGRQIRKIRSMRRTNIGSILDLFQAQDWPQAIDAPDKWPQQTVNDTVRSLNENLKAIKFHSRDGGRMIYWKSPKSQ